MVILLHYSSRNQLRSRDDDVSRDAMEPESLRCARGSPRFQSHKREKMEPMIGGGWWREPACQNFFAQLWRIPSFGKSHTIQNTHHIRKITHNSDFPMHFGKSPPLRNYTRIIQKWELSAMWHKTSLLFLHFRKIFLRNFFIF